MRGQMRDVTRHGVFLPSATPTWTAYLHGKVAHCSSAFLIADASSRLLGKIYAYLILVCRLDPADTALELGCNSNTRIVCWIEWRMVYDLDGSIVVVVSILGRRGRCRDSAAKARVVHCLPSSFGASRALPLVVRAPDFRHLEFAVVSSCQSDSYSLIPHSPPCKTHLRFGAHQRWNDCNIPIRIPVSEAPSPDRVSSLGAERPCPQRNVPKHGVPGAWQRPAHVFHPQRHAERQSAARISHCSACRSLLLHRISPRAIRTPPFASKHESGRLLAAKISLWLVMGSDQQPQYARIHGANRKQQSRQRHRPKRFLSGSPPRQHARDPC